MKRLVIILFSILLLLIGCSHQKKNEEIEKKIQILSSGDINEIDELLFGYTDSLADKDNIIGEIASKASVKTIDISDTEIELEVTAPNMKGVVTHVINSNPQGKEDDLLKEILLYADNAEKVRKVVKLSYTYKDEQLVIDYYNEAFIDALTGGLLSDYKAFRSDSKQSYLEVK